MARSGADAVLVSGLVFNNAGHVIRALRARLGDDVDLMAADGVAPPALLRRAAGRAAHGVFLAVSGMPTEALPPAGAAFVERFARTQPGVTVEPFAVYAAHATDVMLDAIERSDGTRRSVIEELFRTDAPDGLTGPVDFDAPRRHRARARSRSCGSRTARARTTSVASCGCRAGDAAGRASRMRVRRRSRERRPGDRPASAAACARTAAASNELRSGSTKYAVPDSRYGNGSPV